MNLEHVLAAYLSEETNYALLVNGARGTGKTYYIREQFIPAAAATVLPHKAQKKYTPVFLSLYGLKSIDDLYLQLAVEIFPRLKKRPAKIAGGIMRILVRGTLQFLRLGSLDDFLKDLSKLSATKLDSKDFVIIFDDLDRLLPGLSIGELVGFINSLVEHENNKIIIIADEEQVGDKTNYVAVKEKTVGVTVEFPVSFTESLRSIINQRYPRAGGSPFQRCLQQLEPNLIDLFAAGETNNLRTLIYLLQRLHTIFPALYDQLGLQKENPDELSLYKWHTVVRFTTAVCIEFKKGKISFTQPNGIDDLAAINAQLTADTLRDAYGEKNQPEEKNIAYHHQFVATYFNKQTYHFYPSVFSFVTGGDSFDSELLLAELKANIDNRRHQVVRQDVILNQLGHNDCYDLDDATLKKLSEELYGFALAGQLSLQYYYTVIYYLLRWPKILGYDPEEVTTKLINAMQQHAENFSYIPLLSEHFGFRQDSLNYPYYLRLGAAAEKVNAENLAQRKKQNRAELFAFFLREPENFYQELYQRYHGEPVLSAWDFSKFISHLEPLSGREIIAFHRFIKNRYSDLDSAAWQENDFLEQLRHYAATYQNEDYSLKVVIFNELAETLDGIRSRKKA